MLPAANLDSSRYKLSVLVASMPEEAFSDPFLSVIFSEEGDEKLDVREEDMAALIRI